MHPRSARASEIVELVARTTPARVTIVGTSMEPHLRAGMVVDVEALEGTAHLGDVLVFKTSSGLIAHRLVVPPSADVASTAAYVTCGDAHPDRPELVPRHLVIGRVAAVWSGPQPGARRLDDDRSRRRGIALARMRRFRSIAGKTRRYVAYLVAHPADVAPPPAFAALRQATLHFEFGRFARGVASLTSVSATAVLEVSRRHHLSGTLSAWLDESEAAGVGVPQDLCERLRRVRWSSSLQAGRVLACVADVRERLDGAGIPHIFLKGGARLAAGRPGADLHFAGDVDVLVPRERVDDALRALRRADYRDVRSTRERRAYATLQHREPLVSPAIGVPVEVHVALAAPGIVSRPLDYRALAGTSITVGGAAGSVRTLDDVTAAVHLAYHARDLRVWRDIVLLARSLRTFDRSSRARFDAFVAAERKDGVRLRSAVSAAEDLANDVVSHPNARSAYTTWAFFREDLPAAFQHVECIEAIVGRCPSIAFRLDRSSRAFGALVRCWAANALLLPSIYRIARWRRTQGPTDERATR